MIHMIRVWSHPMLFLVLVTSGLACRPKECDAVVTASSKIRAALSDFDLTAAKVGIDAVVAASATSEAREIAWLSGTATTLANSIDEMQRPDPQIGDRDRISADFERHSSNFVDAHRDVLHLCQ